MKTLATIVLGLVVGIASLICFLSSTCAVSGGLSGGGRAGFAICALVSLGVTIGGAMLIAKINRTQ
ncbi:MAG: hypothetical protein ABSD75_15860 [Terriglobales bacterium]